MSKMLAKQEVAAFRPRGLPVSPISVRVCPRCFRAALATLLGPLLLVMALPGAASTLNQAALCDQAAMQAATQTGVPVSVMKAITRTETGRNSAGSLRPWPWTVNMEGKGFWFETESDALGYATEKMKRGARSFDVGCFQINYKWHGQKFGSIEEMFDPQKNALYAARFLQELFSETGSWSAAAGAYHSRTPEYADRYRARFARFREKFLSEDTVPPLRLAVDRETSDQRAPVSPPVAARLNTFPLLQPGGVASLGSLVPIRKRALSGGLFGRKGAG